MERPRQTIRIRPFDRPTCKHGNSFRGGCSECQRERQQRMMKCDYCSESYDNGKIHECIPQLKAQVAELEASEIEALNLQDVLTLELMKRDPTFEPLRERYENQVAELQRVMAIAYDGITTGFHGMSATKTVKLMRSLFEASEKAEAKAREAQHSPSASLVDSCECERCRKSPGEGANNDLF